MQFFPGIVQFVIPVLILIFLYTHMIISLQRNSKSMIGAGRVKGGAKVAGAGTKTDDKNAKQEATMAKAKM